MGPCSYLAKKDGGMSDPEADGDFIPMELRGGWETFCGLPNRFVTLIWKVIGWKGLLVGLTVLMIWKNKIPQSAAPYLWAFIVLVILFGVKGLEFIKDLKK
jgi:hypothetical protein